MGSFQKVLASFVAALTLVAAHYYSSYSPAPYYSAGGFDSYSGGEGGGEDYYSSPNYNFQYNVQDYHGNDYGHQESRKGDQTSGKYQVLLPDGRTQVVNYVADKGGYRAKVSYSGEARHHNHHSGYHPSSYPYY